MKLASLTLLLFATGCPPAESTDKPDDTGGVIDADGDGYVNDGDCDDHDGTVNIGADELCDGKDNDCDGEIDEDATDAGTWHVDADGDGYGDDATAIVTCEPGVGMVEQGGDCDDNNPAYHPGAEESDCTDPEDYNCDGSVEYADGDGDGWPACQDCDDTNADVNPDGIEVCNDIDDDCDGDVDEDAIDALPRYTDADGDGFGTDEYVLSCDALAGTAAESGDCDDTSTRYHPGADEPDCTDPEDYNCDGSTGYADADGDGWAACMECDDLNPDVNPGATETCNGIDDDCDGDTDEDDAADAITWYADRDGDGYGWALDTTNACSQPSGYVADATDCDDGSADIFPGATEYCNSIDDDCDGSIDESDAVDGDTWYADTDGDGWGDPDNSTTSCSIPAGYVSDANDCDDTSADVSPSATESCNGVDDDCDGESDEDDAADALTWYADADSDGFGDAASTWLACAQPAGFVSDATDCDDGDASVKPAGTELCNGVDDDCDGETDEASAADALTWYADDDGDGYGDAGIVLLACTQPTGYVANSSDCDDLDGTEFPGAPEFCDGDDDDCDGEIDEDDAVDASTWYADTDGDGYGDFAVTDRSCYQPAGYVSDSSDCDDADPDAYPGAPEYCDGHDDDCDGEVDEDDAVDVSTWYRDADLDGYGDASVTDLDCYQPMGYVSDSSDCDDGDSSVNPGAVEVCDSADTDEDCNGLADDDDPGATGQSTWYMDYDADGYGDITVSADACDQPPHYVANASDCDDSRDDVHPGAGEVCDDDNNDEDCNGLADDDDSGATGQTTWYVDADGDGYGESSRSTSMCDQPSGYSASSDDCDDSLADVNPGETEVCDNGLDDDCDGTDNGCVLTGTGMITDLADAYWYGSTPDDNVGDAVAAVGDIDGDGFADIGFGTYLWDNPAGNDTGRAWIYSGLTAAGTTSLSASTIGLANISGSYVNSAKDYLGSALDAAGDFDDDGFADVVVGASNTKVTVGSSSYGAAGEAMVFSAPSGDLDRSSALFIVQGQSVTDYVGYAVSGGYDLDGDAVDDIVVGAYGDDTTATNAGAAGLFLGGSTGTVAIDAGASFLTGETLSDQAGQVVRLVPDLNGDGLAEAVICAYKYNGSGSDNGRAYVIYGNATLPTGALSSAADVTIDGPSSNSSEFCRAVASAGDFDKDGDDDLWISAHQHAVVSSSGTLNGAGSVYLFASPLTSSMSTDDASVALHGSAIADAFGRAVSGGDFDGDESPDVAVGAPLDDTPASAAGSMYLWYGSLTAGSYSATTADLVVTGTAASDSFGADLAFLGDTDGNGADDLVIGASGYDASGSSTNYGGAFLLLGGGM